MSSTTHRRDFISRFYPCEKAPWYAPAKFPVRYTRSTGRRRVKRTSCHLRLAEQFQKIILKNVDNMRFIQSFVSLIRVIGIMELSLRADRSYVK